MNMAMPISPPVINFNRPRQIYLQFSTTNKSFLEMHEFLKLKGVKNNAFMLMLYDPDLARINPRDPNLPFHMKQRVLRECQLNYWYFLREIVRVPDTGGSMQGVPYKLHRGNLAYNFLALLNINIYLILPRQQGKTMSAAVRYLYLFNFGTSQSSMYFLNQNHEKSKENLQTLKNIRAMLPSYLRMDSYYIQGKKGKNIDRVETLGHIFNKNVIKTVPSARSRINAGNLLRGKTTPLIWFDEYAFIPFNEEIYVNAVPAYKTASANAMRNGRAYGILVTTTPGDRMVAEGEDAFQFKEMCTKFREDWYDRSYQQIMAEIGRNKKTNFVFLQYSYQQLGLSEQWFESICIDMKQNWDKIRREILLEWNVSTPNAAFTLEQLEAIKRKCVDPLRTVLIMDKYPLHIYEYPKFVNGAPMHVPIIGVDVAGGYNRDYSAITIIDSYTTRVIATFKDNSIDPDELAYMIIEIVSKYMPNAIVNVEKNGIGTGTLKILTKSKIRHNIYYEIKDRIFEEKFDGIHVQKQKVKTRVFGLDNTKEVRASLIQILKERARDHKDKFICKEFYEEFRGLEVKKNGLVEHSDKSHDDLTFSYLMAMYVWTYGENLQQWNLEKTTIKTDEEVDEVFMGDESYDETVKKLSPMIEPAIVDEESEKFKARRDTKNAIKSMGIMYSEWLRQEVDNDNKALQEVLSTRLGREAYSRRYNISPDQIRVDHTYAANYNRLASAIFKNNDPEEELKEIQKRFNLERMFQNTR